MFLEKSHKTITHLVVAVMTAAIVFYSEQALAAHSNADGAVSPCGFALHG